MAKHTKRLLALIMTAFVCLMVQIPSFAAEADATVYDFEDGNISKVADGFSSDDVFSIHTWEDGIDAEKWGKSMKCVNKAGNEAVQIPIGGTKNLFAVEYSFRIDSNDTGYNTFNTDFRQDNNTNSKDLYVLTMDNNQNVLLCNTIVGQYEPGKWYDVKVWFDAPKQEALLLFKENSATEWQIYGARHSEPLSNPGTTKLHFEYFGGDDNTNGAMYIDNLKFFAYTESEKANLMFSNLSYDFENGISSSWEVKDENSQTELAIEPLEGYEGNVMKLKGVSEDGSEVSHVVGNYPFESLTAPDARQKISFKIGSNFNSGSAGVNMSFKDPESGSLSEVNLLTLSKGEIVMGDASEGVTFDDANIKENKLYDAEFIYDTQTSIAVLSVIGENGDIYSSHLDMALSGDQYGTIGSIEFVCQSDGQNETYVDDFVWGIHNATFDFEDYVIKSGMQEDADINETVIFKFTDAVASDNVPTVKIRKDGVLTNVAHTAEAKGKTVEVKFDNLNKASDYTVAISDVECAFGGKANSGAAELTTSDYTVETESLTISDGEVVARIKGAYAGDFKAYIVASAYDAEGNLTEVKLMPVIVPYRTADEVTFTPAFDGAYSFFKAMIIRDFGTAISYSGSVSSN